MEVRFNTLVICDNLWTKGCGSLPLCSRCEVEVESIEHNIFRCRFAQQVWLGFQFMACHEFHFIVSAIQWSDKLVLKFSSFSQAVDCLSQVICVAWSI